MDKNLERERIVISDSLTKDKDPEEKNIFSVFSDMFAYTLKPEDVRYDDNENKA